MKISDSMGCNNPHNIIQTSLSVILDSKLGTKMNKILQRGRGQNHSTETQKHIIWKSRSPVPSYTFGKTSLRLSWSPGVL